MASFEFKIEAEIPSLRRYARVLTRDDVRADDLVQDCLVRGLAKKHLWKEDTDLRAWLFTILHNQYVNNVRRAVREAAIPVPVDEMRITVVARERADDYIANEEVELALGLLPTEQRVVLILVCLEELRYEEVAEVLGVPVGTVRSRLSRGRDMLHRLLDGVTAGEAGHTTETLRSVAKKINAAKRRARYL